MEYRIDVDPSKGMQVPVTIYADDALIQKMMTDRTLKQAINVATLPGIQQHSVVLPDVMKDMVFLLVVSLLWMLKRA